MHSEDIAENLSVLLYKRECLNLKNYLTAIRNHYVPLIVPIILMNNYVRKYEELYLQKQYYLNPQPREWNIALSKDTEKLG